MNSQLDSLLNEEKGVLVSEAANRLRNCSAGHYRYAEMNSLHSNCTKLIQAFRLAIKGEPGKFSSCVQEICKDRMGEGYDLDDMQYALNTIEEFFWNLCLEKATDENEKIEDLHLTTSLIGSAKDRMARQFWEAAQDAVAAAAPIWRKEQDAQVLSWRQLEEKWSKGISDDWVRR